jgi:hypothetical protein
VDAVVVWERTGGDGPQEYRFDLDDSRLNSHLRGVLDDSNRDFVGTSMEYYDVYRSDAEGNPLERGPCVTVESRFEYSYGGGGLNLAEIVLHRAGEARPTVNHVASYVALGPNQNLDSIPAAADGNMGTHTTMGSTTGSERLRVTVGFAVP